MQKLSEIHQDIRYHEINHKGVTISTKTLLLNQKLFLVDYSVLDSVSVNKDLVFYSPQVLLYLNSRGTLELFAILLRTNKGPRSHIMTKTSQPNKFLFAKMHVALADAQVHQFLYHLSIHLMMEPIAIARHNHLSKYDFIILIFLFLQNSSIIINKKINKKTG